MKTCLAGQPLSRGLAPQAPENRDPVHIAFAESHYGRQVRPAALDPRDLSFAARIVRGSGLRLDAARKETAFAFTLRVLA
jgi:hypothetical protein